MARIRPLEPDEVSPRTREVFDRFVAQRGSIPNMFRTMALRPAIMETAEAQMRAIFSTGTVSERLKEMLAVRVSQINECNYCCASHTALAKRQGVSQELLDAMYHVDAHSDYFTREERAALALAERMTTDAHNVDEDVWAEVQACFDDGQIVELAAVIGLFNYFNRFNDALQVQVTQ
jgi:uncharacterized peroxidase-related enzyme